MAGLVYKSSQQDKGKEMQNQQQQQHQYLGESSWVLETTKGWLLANTPFAKGDAPEGVLCEIRTESGSFWEKGVFSSGEIWNLNPIKFSAESPEDLKEDGSSWEQTDLFKTWATLAELGLYKADPTLIRKAVDAWLELEAAKHKYEKTIQSLGGNFRTEGSYEDYEEWLEISGVPLRF